MAKQGSIKHYRQTGANAAPPSLPFGEIAISKDGIIYAGDVNNLPSPQKCNYSLQEHDTGRKWTDGKPIYEKTIISTFNPPPTPDGATANFGLGNVSIVNYSCIVTDARGNCWGDIGAVEVSKNQTTVWFRVMLAPSYALYKFYLEPSLTAPFTVALTIQYTK